MASGRSFISKTDFFNDCSPLFWICYLFLTTHWLCHIMLHIQKSSHWALVCSLQGHSTFCLTCLLSQEQAIACPLPCQCLSLDVSSPMYCVRHMYVALQGFTWGAARGLRYWSKGYASYKICQLLVLDKVWLPMGKTEENSLEAIYPWGRVTHLLAHLPWVAIVKQL